MDLRSVQDRGCVQTEGGGRCGGLDCLNDDPHFTAGRETDRNIGSSLSRNRWVRDYEKGGLPEQNNKREQVVGRGNERLVPSSIPRKIWTGGQVDKSRSFCPNLDPNSCCHQEHSDG